MVKRKQEIVTLHCDKNTQPFCNLIRFWLCSLRRCNTERLLMYSHDITK